MKKLYFLLFCMILQSNLSHAQNNNKLRIANLKFALASANLISKQTELNYKCFLDTKNDSFICGFVEEDIME